MNRLYIAGPISGMPEMNFPAFHAAAARFRAEGWEVVSPVEICPDKSMKWEDCMRRDIPELCKCTHIHLLPGWTRSRGAFLEAEIAEHLGLVKVP